MSCGTELQDEVLTVLAEFGRSVTLRQLMAGTYNPASGDISGESSTDYVLTGALLNYKNYEIDGTLIQSGDRRCLLAAKGMTVVPRVGDLILIDSYIFTVVNFETKEVGGTALAYVLQIRSAPATGGA